jgi:spermidine synthase
MGKPKKAAGASAQGSRQVVPATISEADGVRYLHLDSPWVQGAMRLRKPLALELEYVQRMMAGLLLLPVPATVADLTSSEAPAVDVAPRPAPESGPWADRCALQLGLGAASLTRFCHAVLGLHTTAVEINPSVIQACRLWFRLPPDGERLEVIEADAAAFVEQPQFRGRFSLLHVDLYDQDAAAPVLDSAGFYRACRDLLTPDGVMAVNLFGRDAGFERSAALIAEAFPDGQVLSLRPTREGNTVVIASAGREWPSREEMLRRAAFIEDNWKLPAGKWTRLMRPLGARRP